MPTQTQILAFCLVALLPIVLSLLVVIIPSRRIQVSGIITGNPLDDAPPSPLIAEAESHPLVHLCRVMDGTEMADYVLGLRHLPVERTAPLLERYVHGSDPALQLYAQSVFQQGVDALQHRFQILLDAPTDDNRKAAWLLQTGLSLASTTLASSTERTTWLSRLTELARERLVASATEPSPALLAAAAAIFTEAGHIAEAQITLRALPADSPVARRLTREIQHQAHQKAIA